MRIVIGPEPKLCSFVQIQTARSARMHMRPDRSHAKAEFRLRFPKKKTQTQAELRSLIRAKLAAIATLMMAGSKNRLKYPQRRR